MQIRLPLLVPLALALGACSNQLGPVNFGPSDVYVDAEAPDRVTKGEAIRVTLSVPMPAGCQDVEKIEAVPEPERRRVKFQYVLRTNICLGDTQEVGAIRTREVSFTPTEAGRWELPLRLKPLPGYSPKARFFPPLDFGQPDGDGTVQRSLHVDVVDPSPTPTPSATPVPMASAGIHPNRP